MVLRFDFFDSGIEEEAQGDGECQVHGTLQGSGQHAEKGGVKLETGKATEPSLTATIAAMLRR